MKFGTQGRTSFVLLRPIADGLADQPQMGRSSVLILPPAFGFHAPHIAAFEEPRIVLVANLVAFPIALVMRTVPIRSAIVIAPGAIAVVVAVIIVGIISLAGREGYPKRNDGYNLFHDAPVTH